MATKRITDEAVREAVLAHYLETYKGVTVPELAERLGCSVSTVRKRIAETHGAPPRCTVREEARESYSKSFPGFTSGVHKVWVYYPERVYLAELLVTAREGNHA